MFSLSLDQAEQKEKKIFFELVLIFQPLLRSVPADVLPTQWGGSKDREGICMGGEVTQEYLQQAKPDEIPGKNNEIHLFSSRYQRNG